MGRLWPALEVELPAEHPPTLPDLLLARVDDFDPTAIEENGLQLRMFFSTPHARDAALRAIVAEFTASGIRSRRIEVDDEDFAARSQSELPGVQVGRLYVRPPWECAPAASSDAISIVIEPSMGFGTGHHESTRLCLQALQNVDLAGARVLDIGTGSGVLAIAAVRSGAAGAVAVDVDPDALDCARKNARLNSVESRTTFEQLDFRVGDLRPADVVVANLTGAILSYTLNRLLDLTVPHGTLIVSGFTRDETVGRSDGTVATSPRVEIVDQLEEEGWRCFVLKRVDA